MPAPADCTADADADYCIAHLVGRRYGDGTLFGLLSRNQSDVRDQTRQILPKQNRFGCQSHKISFTQPFGVEVPHGKGFQYRDVDRLSRLDHKTVRGIRSFEVFLVNVGSGLRFGFRLRLGIGVFVGVVVVVVGAGDIPDAQRQQQRRQQQQFFHFHSVKSLFYWCWSGRT